MRPPCAAGDGPHSASRAVVLALRRLLTRHCALVLAASLSPLGCSGDHDQDAVPDHHDEGQEDVGTVSSPLAANATVAQAVAQECATSSVKGLSVQLIEEIQCLRPNTFMRIDNTPGLALGSSVIPYMQTKAAQQLDRRAEGTRHDDVAQLRDAHARPAVLALPLVPDRSLRDRPRGFAGHEQPRGRDRDRHQRQRRMAHGPSGQRLPLARRERSGALRLRRRRDGEPARPLRDGVPAAMEPEQPERQDRRGRGLRRRDRDPHRSGAERADS